MGTEIVFGKGAEKKTGGLVRKYGGRKVMLVYGGGSVKSSGLFDTIAGTLDEEKIPFIELGGVQPNPRRSLIDTGLRAAMDEKVDFLLAAGGGSAIDTAKTIALGLAHGGGYWQFYKGALPSATFPVGSVLTISAAGSETSCGSVVVDDIETNRKCSMTHDLIRPVFAVMNPELTYSVPPYQTAVGAADIFAHICQRYFIDADCYLGDEYCEGTMRTVVKYGPIACANPGDYEARAELMLAGSFGHNDLLNLGRYTKNRGGEHKLEKQLSGFYDTPHGAGLAVIMPAWLQYIANHGSEKQAARVAQFGVNVFGADFDGADLRGTADEGLRRFRAWLKSIGMPLTLKELGVPTEDIDNMVDRCLEDTDGFVPGYMPFDRKAVREIYSLAAL